MFNATAKYVCNTKRFSIVPYKTHDKCLARAYEIAQGMPIHMPMYALKYKCLDIETRR